MHRKAWGTEYRTTLVCIDSYRNGVPEGRFYNTCFTGGKPFQSLSQFLAEMEQVLDKMDGPAAFTVTRTFAAQPAQPTGPPEISYREGTLATFAVRILFRQNASWQGSVAWLEGKQEQNFRSVLELIQLLNSALTQRQAS